LAGDAYLWLHCTWSREAATSNKLQARKTATSDKPQATSWRQKTAKNSNKRQATSNKPAAKPATS
jgi:hypothetical protein